MGKATFIWHSPNEIPKVIGESVVIVTENNEIKTLHDTQTYVGSIIPGSSMGKYCSNWEFLKNSYKVKAWEYKLNIINDI